MVDEQDKLKSKVEIEIEEATKTNEERKQSKEPLKFSQAVRGLQKRLGKTLPEVKTSKIHKFLRDDGPKAFPKPSAYQTNRYLMRKANCMRRTTSFAGIQITEESDEEDTPLKFLEENDKKPNLTAQK